MRVLHVVSALDNGGVENMLYNYITNIHDNDIQFDFIVHEKNEGNIEKKLKNLNTKIYHVTPKKISLLKNIIEIAKIIKNNQYDVVHCHQNFSSVTTLFIAKIYNVKIRIAHCHGCNPAKKLLGKIREKIFRILIRISANYYFACGMNAAKWLYGNSWKENEKNMIMPNAIQIEKFEYNNDTSQLLKDKYHLKDKIVLLHIGRFSQEKNHKFLLDMMKELKKTNSKYKLVLIGDGALKPEIENLVKENNLEKEIIFLGTYSNVSEIINIGDIFLLPSLHEGFPVTTIEAQANGLPVICSESISREISITNTVKFLPINSVDAWIKEIETINIGTPYERKENNKQLIDSKYDIKAQAFWYKTWLQQLRRKH